MHQKGDKFRKRAELTTAPRAIRMNLRGLEAKMEKPGMGEGGGRREEGKKRSGEIFNRGATGGEEIFGKTRWSLNSSHHACECSPELLPNCAARISWAEALHQKKEYSSST